LNYGRKLHGKLVPCTIARVRTIIVRYAKFGHEPIFSPLRTIFPLQIYESFSCPEVIFVFSGHPSYARVRMSDKEATKQPRSPSFVTPFLALFLIIFQIRRFYG